MNYQDIVLSIAEIVHQYQEGNVGEVQALQLVQRALEDFAE